MYFGDKCMREYYITPEFNNSKMFPFAAGLCQLLTIALVFLGYYITAASYLLAAFIQFSALWYFCLFLCNKNYRLYITPDTVTVWNLLKKEKQHITSQIKWKIKRIPWYNTYYVILYSSPQTPIAILKPHWKNVAKILTRPHLGPLSATEREYIAFLKQVGLMY